MEISSAIELINNTIFKPGWIFTAEDWSKRFEGTIKIDVLYPATNSDRDQAPSYSTPIEGGARASFAMVVRDCDDVDLYFRLTEVIACIDSHETREFLRVKGTNWAPFHPHRIDGMRRWAEITGGDINDDLKFGVC